MPGDNEYGLKEYMTELKDTVKGLNGTINDLSGTVNDLRILLVSEYVKKAECEKCRKEIENLKISNDTNHNQFIGWIIGAYGLIAAVIAGYLSNQK